MRQSSNILAVVALSLLASAAHAEVNSQAMALQRFSDAIDAIERQVDASNATASTRYSVHAQVTKAGQVVSTSTQEVQNGGTALFSDSTYKEIDTNVTVKCREGWQRWLQFYKPRCDELNRDVERVTIGLKVQVATRATSNGKVLLSVKGNYVDVIREYTLPGVGADLRSASFRDSSLNSNAEVKYGQVFEITNGLADEEIRLQLTVTPI